MNDPMELSFTLDEFVAVKVMVESKNAAQNKLTKINKTVRAEEDTSPR